MDSDKESPMERLIRRNGGPPAKSPELDALVEEVVKFQKNLVLDEKDIEEITKRIAEQVSELDD